MRASTLFARTLREAPAEAEVDSHRLLLRAAFVRKLMAGIYTWMPLGWRSLRKIEAIVREEMDAAGAQELRMPIVVPAEPWKLTGRWQAYGEEMFKLRDRHARDLGLGPTHEEVVTPLVAAEFGSYRDLPVNVYQIEWKYRDELRPRFGLLRAREFLMKDAYSFDRDAAGLAASYAVMVEAYERVLDRCGISYRMVEADPGAIGGDTNHEFMAEAEIGEDLFVACQHGDYAADLEAAVRRMPEEISMDGLAPITEISTPGGATIQAVVELLGRPASDMLKCIIFDASGRTVAVLLPGDREVNEKKVGRALWPEPVRLFEDDDFAARGLVKGFVGPQGFGPDVTVIADHSVRARKDWVTGANKPDVHVTGANLERDFRVDRWEDVTRVAEGDPCPRDGGRLRIGRSIVVGHTYQLGTRYSTPLEATFTDEDGSAQPYVMGCYGMGLSRIVAAAAEQHHDDAGLVWRKAIAPYHVVVIPTNMDQPDVVRVAETLYSELVALGVEVVLDDRTDAAGVKFTDADLIGYPIQVVIGARGVKAGRFDLKVRSSRERFERPLDEAASFTVERLAAAP